MTPRKTFPRRVFLLDAHEGARRALARLIAAEPDLLVCGEAAGLEEALARLTGAAADALIANFDPLPGGGAAAVGRLRREHPALPIVAVTLRGAVHGQDLCRAGVAGVVVQHEAARGIVGALRHVLAAA